MNKSSLVLILALFSVSASAAEIRGGRVDAERGVIRLDVGYSGGCREHTFKLRLEECQESAPVSCFATLVENANGDGCEAYITRTIELSLRSQGLSDSYFAGGSLQIKGDGGTSVVVYLP